MGGGRAHAGGQSRVNCYHTLNHTLSGDDAHRPRSSADRGGAGAGLLPPALVVVRSVAAMNDGDHFVLRRLRVRFTAMSCSSLSFWNLSCCSCHVLLSMAVARGL